MWPSGFGNASLAEFVDNTLRMVATVGVQHVGLGTDMDSNYRPVIDRYAQVGVWLDGLLQQGLDRTQVAMIAGGNASRLLSRVV